MFNLSSSRPGTLNSWFPSDQLYPFLLTSPKLYNLAFHGCSIKTLPFSQGQCLIHYPSCDCPDDCFLHAVSPLGIAAFSNPLLKSKSIFQGSTLAMKFFLTPRAKLSGLSPFTELLLRVNRGDWHSYSCSSYLAPFGLAIAKGKRCIYLLGT